MTRAFLLLLTVLFPNTLYFNKAKQPLILFERVYDDPKDVFHVLGDIVDGQGYIHTFNNKNSKPGLKFRGWNLGKKAFLPDTWEMTETEVQKNLSLTDSVIGTINKDSLSKYLQMLAFVAESNQNFGSTLVVCSTTNERTNSIHDTSLYGFVYDSKRDVYTRILIEKQYRPEWQNDSALVNEFKQWKWTGNSKQ